MKSPKIQELANHDDVIERQRPQPAPRDRYCDVITSQQACQTAVTSFVECECCFSTQSCLHDVARSVVKLCKSLNLPTSLGNYIERIEEEKVTMSVAEINRWKSLQNKDLSRVERHQAKLISEVKPLKREVAAAARNQSEAEKKREVLRVEYEDERRRFEAEKKKRNAAVERRN